MKTSEVWRAKRRLQREIAATDEKIDALVASRELYGLTEEIGIVEG